MTKDECTRHYKNLKATIEDFLNRFSQEYLNNLHEHQTYSRRKNDSFNKLIVDDMVIDKDNDELPRLQWKKGVTQKLITGRDHNMRRAFVCVIDNQGKIITLKRNCKRLITINNDSKRTAAVNPDIIRKSMV